MNDSLRGAFLEMDALLALNTMGEEEAVRYSAVCLDDLFCRAELDRVAEIEVPDPDPCEYKKKV